MNSSSMREDSASAWPCLVTTVPSTSDTTSSSRTPAGSASTGSPRRSASAQHLAGHRRPGPSVRRKASAAVPMRVQPLDQRPAVGRVGRGQPGAEDDEDVGTGAGERVGRVVDDHVPDDAAEARGAGRDGRAGQPGQLERLLDGQAHPFLPARAVVPARLRRATRRQPSCGGTGRIRYAVSGATSEASPWVTTRPPPVAVQGATPASPVRSPWTPRLILGDFRHTRACDAPHRFESRSTPSTGDGRPSPLHPVTTPILRQTGMERAGRGVERPALPSPLCAKRPSHAHHRRDHRGRDPAPPDGGAGPRPRRPSRRPDDSPPPRVRAGRRADRAPGPRRHRRAGLGQHRHRRAAPRPGAPGPGAA